MGAPRMGRKGAYKGVVGGGGIGKGEVDTADEEEAGEEGPRDQIPEVTEMASESGRDESRVVDVADDGEEEEEEEEEED